MSSRVVIDQAGIARVRGGMVDGLASLGASIILGADVPDAPPIGEGLVDRGAWGVFNAGDRLLGGADAPPGARMGLGLTLLVGFPFPARFNERGTIRQVARPFLDPSIAREVPKAPAHLRAGVRGAER